MEIIRVKRSQIEMVKEMLGQMDDVQIYPEPLHSLSRHPYILFTPTRNYSILFSACAEGGGYFDYLKRNKTPYLKSKKHLIELLVTYKLFGTIYQ